MQGIPALMRIQASRILGIQCVADSTIYCNTNYSVKFTCFANATATLSDDRNNGSCCVVFAKLDPIEFYSVRADSLKYCGYRAVNLRP